VVLATQQLYIPSAGCGGDLQHDLAGDGLTQGRRVGGPMMINAVLRETINQTQSKPGRRPT
jgi:hypothetical protein